MNRLLWNLGLIESSNSVWVIQVEQEVVLHVHILVNEFISLGKLNTLEEVWKVLVNFDFLAGHCETPFHKIVSEDLLDSNDENSDASHEQHWSTPVNTEVNEVL